jgi:hypothetical protein
MHKSPLRSRRLSALGLAFALSTPALATTACTGGIGDGPSSPSAPGKPDSPQGNGGGSNPAPGNNGGGPDPSNNPPPAPGNVPSASGSACSSPQPGPSPLRRLTRAEYDNTVRDLLGEASNPAREFPEEERASGFDNSSARTVSDLLADRYFDAAGKLATAAVTKLPTLLPCDPNAMGEAVCLDKFLDTFARRAWRRPLEASERENLKKAFADGKTTTFAEGIEAVVQVLLMSPQFLYRVELGKPVPGGKNLALTPHELASRLSYTLWGTMPDDQLFAAADGGKLVSRDDVRAQAERMLADPRAKGVLTRFADLNFHLDEIAEVDKDADIFPDFTDALREPLRQETQRLVDKVVWQGDGKLNALLTAETTFVNGTLAKYYGMTGVTGDDYKEVPVEKGKRIGILGHAGILAVTGIPDDGLTALVFRGIYVRERLLCQPLGDPPPNAASESPPFTPTTTAREWSEARQGKANCGACHRMIDPVGFGLENFDGAGRWRDMDRGKPIDSRGELSNTDVDGAFSGVVELAQRLGRSQTVSDCMATQWFRYGYGREETADDACTLGTLRTAFSKSGGNLRELMVALTQTDAFMFRSPIQ